MRSLRTRFTMMTVFAVIFSVVVVSLLSVVFIRGNQQKKSDQLLLLLCETGEKNLDYYFNSVQKSVEKVASFVEADLDGIDDESLDRHMGRVSDYFDEMASKTNGVLTYYYRVDPDVSENVKGFWFVDLDGEGFVEHEVTDITQYDTSDTSKLVWFTVPKYEGKSIWLPPYITDNLEIRVISYNVPIFWRGKFIGVVGIEIDYSTMAEQVNSIRLYNMGYAFLNFVHKVVFPFRDALCSIMVGEDDALPEPEEENEEQEEQGEIQQEPVEGDLLGEFYHDVTNILKLIKETISIDYKVKPDRRDEINITIDGMLESMDMGNLKIMNALIISLYYLLKPL